MPVQGKCTTITNAQAQASRRASKSTRRWTALRIATTEEKRVGDAEGMRVAEARAGLVACTAASEEAAAAALNATRRETLL